MTDGRQFPYRGLCSDYWNPPTPSLNLNIPCVTQECPEDLLREFNYVRRTEPCICPNYRTDADGILLDDNPTIEHRPAPDQLEVRSEQRVGVCLLRPSPDVSFIRTDFSSILIRYTTVHRAPAGSVHPNSYGI